MNAIELEKIELDAPQVPHSILQVWRPHRADSPIHAIDATIWHGDTQVAVVNPVHCLGWKPSQAIAYVEQMLDAIEG